MSSTRRTFVLTGFTLLSGCTTSELRRQPTANESPTETTERNDGSNASDLSNPDTTLQFGSSCVDTDLKITVGELSIETTFRSDGETSQMPDGDALAFAPVTFYNTKSEGSLPIDGPLFTLLGDGTERLETHSVKHPEFDPTIRVRMLEDVPTTHRWSAQGGMVKPDERLSSTAVFRIPASIDSSTLSVVYDSDRIADDRFGDTVVAWTQ